MMYHESERSWFALSEGERAKGRACCSQLLLWKLWRGWSWALLRGGQGLHERQLTEVEMWEILIRYKDKNV